MEEFRLIDRHAVSTEDVTELAWVATWGGQTLHWQLRRLLPSVGLSQTSAGTAPHIVIRQSMQGVWRRAFEQLSLDMSAHISKSSKSQSHRGAPADAGEQAWASTLGVCVILLAWMRHRREKAGKMQSSRALQVFLAGTTRSSPHCIETCWEERRQCDLGLNEQNLCRHLQDTLLTCQQQQADRANLWVQFLSACFGRPECKAVQALLLRLLQGLALEVDEGRERWRAAPHLMAPVLVGPKGKKRTMDPEAKTKVLQEKSDLDGRYWIRQHLASLLHAAADRAKHETMFSIAFDGGRIRKPAVDVNMCVCYLHSCQASVVLPPVVPG